MSHTPDINNGGNCHIFFNIPHIEQGLYHLFNFIVIPIKYHYNSGILKNWCLVCPQSNRPTGNKVDENRTCQFCSEKSQKEVLKSTKISDERFNFFRFN